MEKLKSILCASILLAVIIISGCASPTGNIAVSDKPIIKEFYTESFFVMENGKPHPQFSLKEIVVNKGDVVRLKINVTNGRHDFNIDEFDVHSTTPTGNVTTVEFTAGKSGDFLYYCSMPNHRANGHWGTLKVLDVIG